MSPTIIAQLLIQFGIPLTQVILTNLKNTGTLDEAIAALGSIKSAQEYVDADAKARGVPAVPLPT